MRRELLGVCLLSIFMIVRSDEEMSLREVSEANNKFTNSFYEALRKTEAESENLIFSPFSLSAVIAMVKAGARGKTASEITTAMNFPSDDVLFAGYKSLLSSLKSNENFTLETANKVYTNMGYKLRSEFQDVLNNSFNAMPEQLDFNNGQASAKAINSWVENITRNKIKDLIGEGELNSLTRLVLVNAIYFKGLWKNKFNPNQTKEAPFYLTPTQTVNVPMMKIETDMPYGDFTRDLDARAVAIPYKGDQLSLVILLPNQRDGLKALEDRLRTYKLSDIPKQLSEKKVSLSLPKFRLESKIELKEPLTKLGMGSMFSESEANLSGIPESNEQLYVSKAIQKAFIEINEEGSEAAAATGFQLTLKSGFFGPRLEVNKPFLAYIFEHKSQNVIFFTTVTDPTKESAQNQAVVKTLHGNHESSQTSKHTHSSNQATLNSIPYLLPVAFLPLFLRF